MEARVTALWAAKDGNTPEEYEDAWRVQPDDALGGRIASGPLRAAVGDGATEGMLTGWWAQLLTQAFATTNRAAVENPSSFAATVGAVADAWPRELHAFRTAREANGSVLTWRQHEALMRSADSTLLALHVDWTPPRKRRLLAVRRRPTAGRWHAAAVGDTCLFHVRNNEVVTSFPLTAADQFTNTPDLLGSFDKDQQHIGSMVRMTTGNVMAGDQLLVCTDAVAQWFLRVAAQGERPWLILGALDDMSFPGWVAATRRDGSMHNDDVSVVLLRFEG
jgi:hypothetical protein